ncbi:PTS transporter subunit EIIC [Paenibacillus taichungensis]|uniref:PTS transporter subunit EIIC n=1 Tax=Paenibacillus taichungensis TaxID=484184 RepID=UPI0038D1F807
MKQVQQLIVILVVAPISLIAIGPLGMYVGTDISNLIFWIQDQVGWLTVVIMAILMPLFVMYGIHKVFYPVFINTMVSPGYETLVLVAMLASRPPI